MFILVTAKKTSKRERRDEVSKGPRVLDLPGGLQGSSLGKW